MQWAYPYSLFLLFAAVPLIIFLHSRKPRGAKVRTTVLFLLEPLLKERPMGKRLGWLLKNNLLLLLQILIALILIMALADPSLLHFGKPSGDVVAVVDLSASMKAKDGGGTRFERARRELLALIDSMPSEQRMMVIGAGPTHQLLSSFTSDKGKLRALARSLQPTDAPARVKEAILFAHSFLRRKSHDRVVVVSDGAFAEAEDLPWQSSHLRLIKVDGGSRNVGITGFQFRRLPGDAGRYEVMVAVKNFTAERVRVPLTVAVGDKPWLQEDLQLAPHERGIRILTYSGPLHGNATAFLELEDDFPTDNHAFLALSEASDIAVLYAGKANPFLEHLFRSIPYARVTRVEQLTEELLSSQTDHYDVIVVNGIPSPPVHRGNFIFINTVPQGFPLEIRGKIPRPIPLHSERDHPLTAGLRLDNLYIRQALRLLPKGEGTVLLGAREGPLVVLHEKGRTRALVIGFDLLDSDLPFKVAFPILVSNALEWFQPKRSEFPSAEVQAGTPYLLHLRGGEDKVEVRSPSGRSQSLTATSNPLSYPDTLEAGFYTYKTKSGEGQFAVNLFSEAESTITPPASIPAVEAAPRSQGPGDKADQAFALWPVLLIAVFVLLIVEGYLAIRAGGSLYPVFLRLLPLAGIVLALVNPKIFKAIDALDVILAVDSSYSVGQEGKEKALRVLQRTNRFKGTDTRVGLLLFGREPAWEFFPRGELNVTEFTQSVGRGETDIQAALLAGLAHIEDGRQGRVLLISDGNENSGEAAGVAPLLRTRGSQVWVAPINLAGGTNEIYLKDLTLPSHINSGETFEVKAAIESRRDAPARIRVLRNGVLHREKETLLKAGTNGFSFSESLRDRGIHTYEILVESSDDTFAENNLLQGVVEVRGPPRVLYLYSPEDGMPFFARALKVQGYSVVESSAEKAGLALSELSAFDLVVLDNVPAFRLTQAKMESIERYVRDLGGGLIVIGGPQSYGAGGYYRTPLERVLPVDMRPPSRLDLPHVALLFILDKSGSMGAGPPGASKLDLAKAATMGAADLLNPSDQVGILAFDAAWDWVLPFRPVGKGEWISDRLSALQSDGGTDLYKALVEAHRSFPSKGAAIKHVLVLSDGLTEKMNFNALVEKMARDGITVSTVAVGEDADMRLMNEIAKLGRGRAYVTIDPGTVPQIFTTETLLVSRDLLVEKPVEPKVTGAFGPLRGFSQVSIPPLRGYVLTHVKPRADLLMKVDDDPLLVAWRLGLGQVAAFTSDLSGRWGREWVSWKDFPRWAGQLARGTMKRVSHPQVSAAFQKDGEEVRVVADFLSHTGGFVNGLKLLGTLAAPNQATQEIVFHQSAPGRYEGRFSASQRGVHFLTVYENREQGEAPSIAATVPFISPYPDEYRSLTPNHTLLNRLAEGTGGEILDLEKMDEGLKRLFTPDPGKGASARETWWIFSGLGLLFFLADLALRRWPGFGTGRI